MVPLTAPAKNGKVTITNQGLPDEFTLKGVDISVVSGSEVVENGPIKDATQTGQFVAPDHPEQIT
jgi:hypothetical protein